VPFVVTSKKTLKSGLGTLQGIIPVVILIITGICSCYTGKVLSAYNCTCPVLKTRVLALQNIPGFDRRPKTTFQIAGYMFLVDTTHHGQYHRGMAFKRGLGPIPI